MTAESDQLPLQRGSEYRVVHEVGDFIAGGRWVYVGDFPSYQDNVITKHALTFFDQQTGETRALMLVSLEGASEICSRHFKFCGGWVRPEPRSIVPVDHLDFAPSTDILKTLLPYLKGLVEGDKNIENWFVWIARHERLLESVMSPSQFLHFRYSPYDNACELLQEYGVDFNPGVRHQWLRL